MLIALNWIISADTDSSCYNFRGLMKVYATSLIKDSDLG